MDISRRMVVEPSSFVDFAEFGSIIAVHFSPFEWSQDVILIAFKDNILVGYISFNESLEFEKLGLFSHKDICTALALSPETSVNSVPVNIQFCTAGNEDFVLRVFKGNLSDENVFKILVGHKNYINDLSFDQDNNYLASVSDDNTAKIWSIADDYECLVTFNLSSPGMSTCWHRRDPSKLLVAEKNGLMRFYNVSTQKPIMSLDIGKSLSAAHWAPSDPTIIGSLNMGELVLWDVTKPSCPTNTLIYTQNGGFLKFSPLGELVATVNKLEGTLKVTHMKTLQQRLSVKVTLPTNLSWHFRFPLVCLGDDTKLCFWKVISK